MTSLSQNIFFFLLQIIVIPALSPLAIGIIRKIKAKMQNREGASVLQPYFDLRKLFRKDEVISESASWIFRVAPYIVFGVTVCIGASIPIFSAITPYAPAGDFLIVVYLLLLGTFFLALAGMDAASAFGGFGSSREMMVAALAEGGLFFALLVPSFAAGTTNLAAISVELSGFPLQNLLPIFVAFIAFFIALLAENARFPVDNPATHLELTMIHEAMILEYSGKRLALLEWAAANKLLIFIALGANIFFPWGLSLTFELKEIVFSVALFLVKSFGFLMVIALLESTIAKFRIFRVPDLLFTSFVLAVIALVIIITI